MDARQRHADRIERALECNEAARNAVVASWQRSRSLHALDPRENRPPRRLDEGELARAREALGPLLDHAAPSLDRLYQAVGNVGCCVLLADADGVPVARRGAVADDRTFESWGLWTGTVWSEASEGTNGIGTCIVEKRPVTIHKSDHFHARNIGLSCMGAPIFDHQGRLAAVIDVSSCRADLTEEFSQLISVTVMDAACRIEMENFRQRFAGTRIVFAGISATPGCAAESGQHGAGLLAVDADDLVVGATRQARRLYRLTDDDLQQSVPLATLTGQASDDAGDYAQAEYKVIQKALARARGNISLAARSIGISRSTLHRKLRRFRAED
jgi:transcriptional regulator of acetoin/glycerol metabolism